MEASRHPIDFDALAPGSVISAAECQRIFGVERRLRAYQLKLLEFGNEVSRRLSERYGRIIVVVQRKDGLAVLTEAERVAHVQRQAGSARRKRRRAVAAARDTDISQLTDEQRRDHERFLLLEAWRMQAERETTTRFIAEERKRSTPLAFPIAESTN